MPKITHGGPTLFVGEGAPLPASDELPEKVKLVGPGAPKEDSCPGNSSSPSDSAPEKTPDPKKSRTPDPARTTGGRSTSARTANSSASSTGGPKTKHGK